MRQLFKLKRLKRLRFKYKKVVMGIAVLVVFITTYALILPAITLDNSRADQASGLEVAETSSTSSSTLSTSAAVESSNPEDSQVEVSQQEDGDENPPLLTTDTRLTADKADLTVEVDLSAAHQLPADVALAVEERVAKQKTYEADLAKAKQKLANKDILDSRFYDIALVSGGQEVEPQAAVLVTITLAADKALTASKENLLIFHIKSDGTTEFLNPTNVQVSGDKVTAVSFEATSFSDYGLLVMDDSSVDEKTSDADNEKTASSSEALLHRVTFVYTDNDGKEQEVAETHIENGKNLTGLPDNPFRQGYRFVQWVKRGTNEVVTTDTLVTEDLVVEAQFESIDIYTVTVKYYYHNSANDKDVTFETEIFQVESKETPYRITPPASTVPEEDANQPREAIYYPEQSLIELTNADNLAERDASDGKVDNQINITIQYVPYTAQYNVRYMLKNLDGEGYSEIETVKNYGVIGATVRPQVLTYTYATFEKTETTEITEPEGQNIDVYYTRKPYTLSYNVDGGTYIPPQTALYETKELITEIVPTKEGYTFAGWYDNPELTGSPVTKTVTLDKDVTLYAKWEANTVNYTIAYYKEQYDNSTGKTSYVYDSSRTARAKVGTSIQARSAQGLSSIPTGYQRESAANGMNANSAITVAADGTSVLKVYYDLIRYTFVFNLNGPYQYANGNSTGRINKNNQYYYNSDYKITDVVLERDISSEWPSGSDVSNTYGNAVFAGWSSNSTNSLYVTRRYEVTEEMIAGAVNRQKTYIANWQRDLIEKTVDYYLQSADDPTKYELSNTYSQTYYSRTATTLSGKEIAGFTLVTTPSGYPDSEGYWTGGYWNQTFVTNHYRFYYKRDSYDIEYYYDGTRLNTIEDVLFDANINSTKYDVTPERPSGVDEDYTWGGWYTDANLTTKYTFDKMPTHNLVLYANWIAPEYTVSFDVNGGESATPATQTVEKYKLASAPADPTREHYIFEGWFTEDGERYDWSKPVTKDTKLIAHWNLKPLTYTVRYVDADNYDNQLAADKVITSPALVISQELTESALAITGYRPDSSSKSILLDYENNVITFYYTKKTPEITYTVRYLLADEDDDDSNNTVLHEPVTHTVSGNAITVKETAPDVGGAYYPLEEAKSLTLTSKSENNVITFYYVTYDMVNITVNYLDMDGKPIPGQEPLTIMKNKPYHYRVDRKAIAGYTYNKSDDSDGGANKVTYDFNTGKEITINLYYQKDLMLEANSKEKTYDGMALTSDSDVGELKDTYADLLESGDHLTSIRLTGSQTDAGSSDVIPSKAVITDEAGKDRNYYYNITYVNGMLTVNPLAVMVTIDGETQEKVYDGTYSTISYQVTNISNDLYKESDIQFNGLDSDKALSQKDAGTYELTLVNHFANANENFDVTFTVSNGQLTIKPRQVTLTSQSASQAYDGEALTQKTVTISEPTLETGFITGEGIERFDITGSQTEPGSSANAFTYTLQANTQAQNYDITTDYGRLTVLPSVNLQKTTTDWKSLAGGKFILSHWDGRHWAAVTGVDELAITSAEAGVTIPVGLGAGTYRIRETAAPDGYVVLDSDLYFTVTEATDGATEQKTYTVALSDENGTALTTSDKAQLATARGTYSTRIQIANEAGKALPDTGGHGTKIYLLAGLGLMLSALVGTALRKGKGERSDFS